MLLPFDASVTPWQPLPHAINTDTNTLVVDDNLNCLQSMAHHQQAVDLVYIDPPYNTKKNTFRYNDTRKTSDWVDVLYKRLCLAHAVLKETGVILISIDDAHYPYIKLMMDEIFGIQNFVANFIWRKSHTVKNDKVGVSTQHEYVLCFAKNKALMVFNREPTGDGYIQKAYRYHDSRGRYRVVPLHKDKNKVHYPITAPNGMVWVKGWNYNREGFQRLLDDDLIYWGKDGTNCPSKKVHLKDTMEKSYGTLLPTTVGYTGDGKKDLEALGFSKTTFLYAKPVRLIKHLLAIFSRKDSLVMDFFAGSGTTAEAVISANADDGGTRRFIMCTNNEDDIAMGLTLPRIKKAFAKYQKQEELDLIAGEGFS